MAFLKDKDRAALEKEFKELTQPVKLVLFVEEQGCEYCGPTKLLLEEVAALSDKLSVETFNLTADKDKAAEFQVDKAPAIALVNGKDYGIRYYGIPSGYEFSSLIEDIVDVSKGESGLSAETKTALAGLDQPMHIQVFVTPTCPYCTRAVRTAHKMALESSFVRADMIEATEFPDLAEKYQVMAVPRVVINDTTYFEGALPESQFLQAALQAVASKN
jgi:glutaredoxin-like protein